jgi:hypothetical protein
MVSTLIEQYRVEKMPTRYSTRRSYEVWLRRIGEHGRNLRH